jgi:hypothetical protein
VNSKVSAADTKSELETHPGKKGADESHDKQGRADGSHGDEKELRVVSPAMSDYMLKCS